jgi:hypothetical protein
VRLSLQENTPEFLKKYTCRPFPLFLPFFPDDVNTIATYAGFMVMKASI